MNAYETQPVRKAYGVNFNEEYIMGMVDREGAIAVTDILSRSSEIMTLATTHKYICQLIDKGLLKHSQNKEDMRVKLVIMTKKGINFIKELNETKC